MTSNDGQPSTKTSTENAYEYQPDWTKRQVDLDFIVNVAEDLISLTWEIFEKFGEVTLEDVINGKRTPLYRARLARQIDELNAITTLTRAKLGHVAPAYLRPACEEYFWIKYLNTLQPLDIRDILLTFANLDNLRAIQAQQMFIGKKGMKQLGFPAAFVNETTRTMQNSKSRVADIGMRLGWPTADDTATGPSGVPSTHWVANKVGEGKLYDYLYSATSRHVHFSVGELLRRTEVEPSHAIDYKGAEKRRDRSFFSIHWGVSLLLQTASECIDSEGPIELPDDFQNKVMSIAGRLGRYGVPPLTHGREWNGAWKVQ
ncbi:DUF5677 domain-containing protein [Streptomyces sp. NPDC044780]|uniref:DUF5677 domain-containing protein n=1 Tax=unclassified Streptomyces TaxID=2593676 RepID=UPI0033E05C68